MRLLREHNSLLKLRGDAVSKLPASLVVSREAPKELVR
jgi:hypothetical protein